MNRNRWSSILRIGALAACMALPARAQAQDPKPIKVRDGDAAIVQTALSVADATAKVKAYFNSKNIDFTVNRDTDRLTSDWYNERGCGIGFNKCANRAMVRVVAEEGHTVVQVQVFERKHEGGLSAKPWTENSKSKGNETGQLAATLEAFLNK